MQLNISTPTLLIDKEKCLNNIARMVKKANRLGIPIRPHFKTHQSHGVGRWYREFGIDRIAVSSLQMAHYFANDNWTDITVAFPTNPREIDLINDLASRIDLKLLVESQEITQYLSIQLKSPVKVYIKADIGYHRTGLSINQTIEIDAILDSISQSDKLEFEGFLGHAGHSYAARSSEEILQIHRSSIKSMHQFLFHYKSQFPSLKLSYGDTPTCSIAEEFPLIDEIRPGNFVFYDLAQSLIGSCQPNQIAVAMACPVVAKHSSRQEIVVYGGGVHFSKDRSILPDGTTYYGLVVNFQKNQWVLPSERSYVKSLSQEHGIILASEELFQKTNIGDLIYVLPIHSCMAVNAMKSYRTLEGEHLSTMV